MKLQALGPLHGSETSPAGGARSGLEDEKRVLAKRVLEAQLFWQCMYGAPAVNTCPFYAHYVQTAVA